MIIGPILVVSILIMAPESPRLMIKNGKDEQALNMLSKYHANGDVNDPLVKWEFQEIQQALELEELNNKTSYVRPDTAPFWAIVGTTNHTLSAVGLLQDPRQSQASLGFDRDHCWRQLGWQWHRVLSESLIHVPPRLRYDSDPP